MTFVVYILKSLKDGGIYIGRTNDIERRIKEHQNGRVSSIKSRRPLMLLEKIVVNTEKESVDLEREFKKGYKREELKRKFGIG